MIGVFDSGVGGITVLNELRKLMPNENYIYYADTDNVPYGTKSKEEVIGFVNKAIEYLINQSVSAIVIACNTATSVAIDQVRSLYKIPIFGMEPAIKPAILNSHSKKVLVMATTLALEEKKIELLIDKLYARDIVIKQELDRLVTFAESNRINDPAAVNYIKEVLSNYNLDEFSFIVLGCTHFVFFKNQIQELVREYDINVIDGNLGTAKNVYNTLGNNAGGGKGIVKFIKSGRECLTKSETDMMTELTKKSC